MDETLARKHYRAAYVFDPTYQPALVNLERISVFERIPSKEEIDYGDQPEIAHKSPYVVVYDNHHVGHLIKKEME